MPQVIPPGRLTQLPPLDQPHDQCLMYDQSLTIDRLDKQPTSINDPVKTPHRGVFTLKPNSLGAIAGQFKAACTRCICAAGYGQFAWQTRFYGRVIRTPDELEKIRAYVRHNPLMWDKESGTPANLEL